MSFRFAVTDTVLGITTHKEVTLKIENPLENAWFVLQNQVGKSVLGAVDGSGIGATVYKDIYQHLLVGRRDPRGTESLGGKSGFESREIRDKDRDLCADE